MLCAGRADTIRRDIDVSQENGELKMSPEEIPELVQIVMKDLEVVQGVLVRKFTDTRRRYRINEMIYTVKFNF